MKEWMKRNWKKMLGVFFFIIAVFFLQLPPGFSKAVGVCLILGALYLSGVKIEGFIPTLIFGTGVVLFVWIGINWWQHNVFLNQIITDNMMLVIVTIAYVILTYINLASTKKAFDISRLPRLMISMDKDKIIVKNKSETYPAMNLEVEMELIYPIPKNFIEHIECWFLSFVKVKRGRLRLFKRYELAPETETIIPVEKLKFFKEIINAKRDSRTAKTHLLSYRTNKKYEFYLDIVLRYETDTGYIHPVENKSRFHIICDKKGCYLANIDSDLEQVL
ncbi:hypothetical protein JW756_05005 [Candidatus Woesearchaeota archaeon]|nr:hypothetical protein [Candidatus Woesearchaeota archaeon]